MLGYLRKIIPFSSVDGPGNRSAIFLQGCNLDCLYCHNPETIPIASAEHPIAGVVVVTPDDIVDQILPNRHFISGVTLSGGECSVQGAFLVALCKRLKEEKIPVFIDTNGMMSQALLYELMPLVDQFMFDVKAILPEDHLRLTGALPDRILENLLVVAQHHQLYEIRTVVVPDILDNTATVTWVSRFIVSNCPGARYKLIKYRSHGTREHLLEGILSPNDATMNQLSDLAQQIGVQEIIIL